MLSGEIGSISSYLNEGFKLNDFQLFMSEPMEGKRSERTFKEVYDDFNEKMFLDILTGDIDEMEIPNSIPLPYFKKYIMTQPIAIREQFESLVGEDDDFGMEDDQKCKRFFYAMCLSKVATVFKILYAVDLEEEKEALKKKKKVSQEPKPEVLGPQVGRSEEKKKRALIAEIEELSSSEDEEDEKINTHEGVKAFLLKEEELSSEIEAIQTLVDSELVPEGFKTKLYQILGPQLQKQMVEEGIVQPFAVSTGHVVTYFKKAKPFDKSLENQLSEIRPSNENMRWIAEKKKKYARLEEKTAREVYASTSTDDSKSAKKLRKKLDDYFLFLEKLDKLEKLTRYEEIIKKRKIYMTSKIKLDDLLELEQILQSGEPPDDFTAVLMSQEGKKKQQRRSRTRGNSSSRGRSRSKVQSEGRRVISQISEHDVASKVKATSKRAIEFMKYDSDVKIQEKWFAAISDDLYKISRQRVRVPTLRSKWSAFKKSKQTFKTFLNKIVSNSTLIYDKYYQAKLSYADLDVNSLVEEGEYSFFQFLEIVCEILRDETTTPALDAFYVVFFVNNLRRVPIQIIPTEDIF